MNNSIKSTLSDRGSVIQTNSRFKWIIENFPDYCRGSGERILSPIFSNGSNGEYKWRLELYPYNYQCRDSDYLSLYVLTENNFTVTASYELSIYNEYTDVYYNKRTTSNQKFKTTESWGFHKFIARHDLLRDLEICKNKTLTILFELFSVYLPDETRIPGNHATSCAVQRQILQNYEQLLMDEHLWDVTLVDAKGKELRAHKAILSSGSVVFASMFAHDMQEKLDNTVKIEDIEYDTLKELLRFIYAGKVENLENLAKSLYVAADKYGIEELMTLCTDYLCQSLSVNNAVDRLSFGYLHGLELLKNIAKKYIVCNAKDFVELPDFKSLNNPDTEMIFELFQELVSHKNC